MKQKQQLFLFFGATLCIATAMGVHESVFNNFLSDAYDIAADSRGMLEFPRELPGFLVVVMAGALAVLPVTRLGLVGCVVLSIGLAGMAVWGFTWNPMIVMMLVASAGMHLLQPVGASIAIGLSDSGSRGRRMGQVGAVGTIGVLIGCGLIWLFFDAKASQYSAAFFWAAAAAGLGALFYGLMHVPRLHQPRSRFVMRRKFGLYYVLELFFGARKQIFITFGPWVLIRVYDEPATVIAQLFTIAAIIGVVFKPLAGMAIDRFGERNVMVVDGVALAIVCVGYGFAIELTGGDHQTARLLACCCFVIDNLLFALGTSRAVYVSRLADSPQEITSTLAMGISVNHIVSMIIPIGAGLIWEELGYQYVFLAAAVLALVISAVSALVPAKGVLVEES